MRCQSFILYLEAVAETVIDRFVQDQRLSKHFDERGFQQDNRFVYSWDTQE